MNDATVIAISSELAAFKKRVTSHIVDVFERRKMVESDMDNFVITSISPYHNMTAVIYKNLLVGHITTNFAGGRVSIDFEPHSPEKTKPS